MEGNMADPNTEREPLEVLAAEYMEQLRQGQQPSIEDYAAQHSNLAEESVSYSRPSLQQSV